jgi:hypothetical protein
MPMNNIDLLEVAPSLKKWFFLSPFFILRAFGAQNKKGLDPIIFSKKVRSRRDRRFN